MAAAILDFYYFSFLTAGTVKSAELRHNAKFYLGFLKFQIFNDRNGQEGRTVSSNRAKFRRNRSNRGRDVSFNIMLIWLEYAYSRPFLRVFWGTFSP